MSTTRIRLLAAIAIVSAAAGWGFAAILDAIASRIVPVPWLAPATLWVLAVALLAWTLLSRPRLLRRPGSKPMPPLVAARTAALAMAASRTGSVVGGFYAGVLVGVLPSRSVPAGASSMWASGAAALGSVAVIAVALWLEHLCRIREDGATPGGRSASDPASDGGSWATPRQGHR